MLRFSVFLMSLGLVCCEINWVTRGQVSNPSSYFSKVVQQLVYDLEKKEWCNLKIPEYSQTLNEELYHWHVVGKVTYSNGFVISIQAMDVLDFDQSVFSKIVDGESIPHATVQGKMNMHDVKLGFDVLVELEDPDPPHAPVQRYTGVFTHPLIQLQLDVTRNLFTKEMTSSARTGSVTSGGLSNRMIYMPANNLTEVLSGRYQSWNNNDGVDVWCSDIINPMLLDVAKNQDFPEICFNNCPK